MARREIINKLIQIQQSRITKKKVSMGELVLHKKGSLQQKDNLQQNIKISLFIATRKSGVGKRKSFVIENDQEDEEGDTRFHDPNDVENDDIEDTEHMVHESNENDDNDDIDDDIDVDEANEAGHGFEDDGDEDMNDSENDVEYENNELGQEDHAGTQLLKKMFNLTNRLCFWLVL
uniref:histone chaperone RTT106-like n=1 Tax=Erigeron canadensis TaxID=72917 RepID=UPI001CB962F8|nr:histone chaperone RTT106-like [Erigeron canadensis]